MTKVFKGKVKYDFWIGTMGKNTTKFMSFCLLLELLVFGAIYFSGEDIDYPVLLILLAAMIIFCYWYHGYYKARLELWDKPGFEILEVDEGAHLIRLDKSKIIPFAHVAKISFVEDEEVLPYLNKTYDTINAKMIIHLLNGEPVEYYVQQLSTIYKMINYFRSLNFKVKAENFDSNAGYKARAHYWLVIFIAVAFFVLFGFIFD